jgi:hypothetical protein
METGTIHFYRGAIRIAQLIQTRGLSVYGCRWLYLAWCLSQHIETSLHFFD